MQTKPTAGIIIIGNEVLSGRTQDINTSWIARELNDVGISVPEVRIVLDDEAAIIAAVNDYRRRFTYVFTTGGIGPTHDDITAAAIAKAFGLPYELHPEAEAIIRNQHKENTNAARLQMAHMPKGASLITPGVTPGFKIENVYVMPGIPSHMQRMFSDVKPTLKGGLKTLSRAITAKVREGDIAEGIKAIQDRTGVEIGSYPSPETKSVTVTASSTNQAALDAACDELRTFLLRYTSEITEESLATDWREAVNRTSMPKTQGA